MSVESLAIALHHSKASGTARLILVGIANHDGDGGAWPSVGTLAHYAGITPRVVQKHLDTLSDLGEIVKHVQQGGDRTMADYERPNLYEFLLTCPDNCDRTKQHRACKECGEPARKSKKFICTACQLAAVDNSQNPLSPVTPPVTSDTRPPVTSDTPPLSPVTPKPSLNHPLNNQSPFVGTSPAAGSICWACGNQHSTDARYCQSCRNNGMDSPWIPCTDCTAVRKRNRPGQQSFTCKNCKDE